MNILTHLKVILVISVYNIINMIFLAVWVLAQWAFKIYVLDQHELIGLDLWVLRILQSVFLIATLTPVVAWVYFDTRAMIRYLAKTAEGARNDQDEVAA